MKQNNSQVHRIAEIVFVWLILMVLLTFSFDKFFLHVYGFSWTPTGVIDQVFVFHPQPTLKVGDQLVQVGSLTWEDFDADLRKTFFADAKPGDITPIQVERSGRPFTVLWKLPGTNFGEWNDQLYSEWPLAYIFWLAGLLTLLFLRPKDERWWLLSAFNFLTAIWISAGSGLSNFHIGYSALILRMTIWLSVPVYLHLHWVFPRPLGKLPPLLVGLAYTAAVCFVVAQGFQLFSKNLYFLGLLFAVLGSLILLIVHAVRQPDTRRDLSVLLFTSFFIFFVPLLLVAVIGAMNTEVHADSLALLGFPLLPAAYLYIAYRRQLGGLEIRANRFISIYSFLILLGAIELPMIVAADNLTTLPERTVTIAGAFSLLTAVACLWGYPAYQRFIERRILGIRLPSERVQETYSAHITTGASLSSLDRILADDLLPSLLVRQFVFLKFEKDTTEVLFSRGNRLDQIPGEDDLHGLKNWGEYQILSNLDGPLSWLRLALPLKVGDETLGMWLFGRRDPDDLYSQIEIPILQSLANQTAVALSNIIQTERLKALYEANINRYEQERLHLAHGLHDSILNEMAAMLMKETAPLSPSFQQAYSALIERLREIVSDLRPPMLQYGLKAAIAELADNLMERSGDTVSITLNLQGGEQRYDEKIERNVYRIVQQACENALQHGEVKRISIDGVLDAQAIDLKVEEDGIGFDARQGFVLDDLLAN